MASPPVTDALDRFLARGDLWSVYSALAEAHGEVEAILAPGRAALTFGALPTQVAVTKRALNRCGVGRGDRVAVILQSGPEMAVCSLAVAASAVLVPLDPAYTEDEFRRYLVRLQPKLPSFSFKARSPDAAGREMFEESRFITASASAQGNRVVPGCDSGGANEIQ